MFNWLRKKKNKDNYVTIRSVNSDFVLDVSFTKLEKEELLGLVDMVMYIRNGYAYDDIFSCTLLSYNSKWPQQIEKQLVKFFEKVTIEAK